MAAVVDADEREARGQRLVGGEELEVAGGGPAVQQHDDRRRRVRVTVDPDEELAPALDPDGPALG